MHPMPEPDRFEKRLRFVCGFFFGIFIGFCVLAREVVEFSVSFWSAVAGIGIILGLLAMRYGDAFWRSIADWLGR